MAICSLVYQAAYVSLQTVGYKFGCLHLVGHLLIFMCLVCAKADVSWWMSRGL